MFLVFVDVLLGEAEIDHENARNVVFPSNEEIVRFDITMKNSPGMNKFDEF